MDAYHRKRAELEDLERAVDMMKRAQRNATRGSPSYEYYASHIQTLSRRINILHEELSPEAIDEAAEQRRRTARPAYPVPSPEEVRERLKRRSDRTRRAWKEDRKQVKKEYHISELNPTSLRAPHVVREMDSTKGARRRRTRKQRRHRT